MTKPLLARLIVLPVLLGAEVLPCPSAWAQTKRALLIGINTYQPPGTAAQHPAGCIYGRCELAAFQNLEGAVNDAQTMAELLTSPKFGFPKSQVVILTTPEQTTHDAILAAMQKYLVDLPQRGDTVVFYDASHGSLRINSKGIKLTVLVNGKLVHADSTLVPSDAYQGGYDVRDREMTRIFNAALDKGVHLTVILDSCHSGGATRGDWRSYFGLPYLDRALAYDPRDVAEEPETQTAPAERTDNPALVFAAAQQDQQAKEVPAFGSREAHGAFTLALVRALETLPADAPASLVYSRVKAALEGNGVGDQDPEMDAGPARRGQPLFGGTKSGDGKVMAAALKTDPDSGVWLDIGQAAGVGAGSEFVSSTRDDKGYATTLRVTALQGIARSSAEIVTPPGAKVIPGDLFTLTKWVPAESDPLLIWMWPPTLNVAQIKDAVAQVRASGVALVADPAEEPWTDMLAWDSTHWTLQHASAADGAVHIDKPTPVDLGATLTADALKKSLTPGARLWANLPPPKELTFAMANFARQGQYSMQSALQVASDFADASYLLTGTLTTNGPAYAWMRKQEFDAGPQASKKDHTAGCSTTSQYPVRSDWVLSSSETMAATLNQYAQRLAKAHAWLSLADNRVGASASSYYSLGLLRAEDQASLPADQAARQDDRLLMALGSDDRVIERRWVYVLDIDCQGKGTLLYPVHYAENRFPNDAETARWFALPGAGALRIGPPYGVETMILLSTSEPLPDPEALAFDGAAKQSRSDQPPLQRLLSDTSRGTRDAAPPEMPTNWGISLITLRSIPKEAVP